MTEKDSVNGEQLAKFLETDVRCWKAAIQIHNRDVAGGKNKADKYYITVEGDNLTALGDVVCVSPVASADDLIKAAETAHKKLVGKQGKGARVFYSIVTCFQMYSKAIDVFIQQEPRTTALIWGTVRILLQAAVDIEEASEVTADGILLIAQHAGRWAKMARCFGYEPAVEEALTDLYVQVLGFVLPAMHHLHKGPWERLGKSLLCSVSRKLNTRLSKLKDASERLDKMVQLENNEHCQKIVSLLSRLDAPMDRARVMRDALLSYNGNQGRWDANLDAPKIKEWFSPAANPIAARPQGLAVATASIDEAEPYIVRHPRFRNWLTKPHLKPLWVSGAPGCGKSTIAHKCVEYLAETQDSSTIVSHAFESTGPTEHRRLMSLAASILDQLLPRDWVTQAQKHVFERLVSIYNQYRLHSYDCPFEQLWDHCASLLKSETRFILVIDALDECNFDRADQFQGFLDRILDLLSSTTGRILIFTRPCPVLGVGVTRELNDDEIRISIQDTLPEINAFCDSASAKLPLPKELQLKVANRARSGAQGSFLWASLFLRRFTNVLDKNSVMKRIDEFPDNCWGRYIEIWHNTFSEHEPQVQDNCRRILLVLLGARQKFSLEDIEDSLELLPNAALRVSKACQPLLHVVDGVLQLSHASVREFLLNDDKETQTACIGISKSEPDETLARTCLKYLLREDYAHTDRIGQRLRRNVGLGGSTEGLEQNFYNYAARNWYKHLAALSSPDPSLLKLAEQFLHATQFAYWAEYSYTDAGDFQAIRSTEIALHIWRKSLPGDGRVLLRLDDYFERPYRDLSKMYREKSDDKVLQWLALMHLGFYYFDKGKMSEMAQARQEVAAGLSELLGRLNPLTLRARSDEAYSFLFSNDLREAQRLYAEVYDDQRKVSDNDPSLFFTLIYQGQVEYLMTNSSKALEILTSAVAGFLRTSGPESNGFLISQLWYAVADASVGHTSQAVKMMEYVREKREERYGPDDSFGMATKIFAGDLYRKLEKKEEALANIEPALEFRRAFWSRSHFLTIDTALVLAAAYRDFGMNDLAEKIVDDLELHGKLEQKENYFRLCQVRHLRGLLLFDGGDVDQAITLLEALLIEHGHGDSNNRALQWVRLDLAEMLRYRGREGDERLASSLFDGIVTDGGGREPDPPRWLEISEAALRLVRDGKLDAAEELLRREKLRWTRAEDLWMCLGMPAADTGWMKPPRGLGAHASDSGWVSLAPG